MTEIILQVEDKSILPHLKKILGAIKGVSISKSGKARKTGIQEALEDVKEGRITRYESVDDLFKAYEI